MENKEAAVATGLFVGWVLPSIIRPAITMLAQELSGIDLKTAMKISALPKAGSYLAVPADLAANLKHLSGSSEEIWHYTLRNLVARLSKILKPWGGWGTQHEAELWDRLKPLFGANI